MQLEAAACFKGKTLKGRVGSPVLPLSSDAKEQGVGLLNCLLVSSPTGGVSVESGWISSPVPSFLSVCVSADACLNAQLRNGLSKQ